MPARDANGAFVYVTNTGPGPGPMSVIDTTTQTVVTTISVGFGAAGVAMTPARGGRAYVANSSVLLEFRTSDHQIIGIVNNINANAGVAITPVPPQP